MDRYCHWQEKYLAFHKKEHKAKKKDLVLSIPLLTTYSVAKPL